MFLHQFKQICSLPTERLHICVPLARRPTERPNICLLRGRIFSCGWRQEGNDLTMKAVLKDRGLPKFRWKLGRRLLAKSLHQESIFLLVSGKGLPSQDRKYSRDKFCVLSGLDQCLVPIRQEQKQEGVSSIAEWWEKLHGMHWIEVTLQPRNDISALAA